MKHCSHLFALVFALSLAGCGQKGPLYLPDTKAGEIVTRPAPAQSTEATPPPAVPAPVPVDESEKDKKNGAPPPQ